jgi:hypothetical protein
MSGALTNVVYRATATFAEENGGGQPADRKTVLLRVYGVGAESFVDREQEVSVFVILSVIQPLNFVRSI